MSSNAKIIVVEDDEEMRQLIADYLRRSQMNIRTVGDGTALMRELEHDPADLVVLDIMLPGRDGLDLCKRLRADPRYANIGIIMLTARDGMLDRILGLELGADDYLSKPFEPLELQARIKALLRRSQQREIQTGAEAQDDSVIRFEGWELDTRSRQLRSPKGVLISLASSDFSILLHMLRHPSQPISRDKLMAVAFNRERTPLDRSVDVCISRLRAHLESEGNSTQIIRTIRHEGYMYSPSRPDGGAHGSL